MLSMQKTESTRMKERDEDKNTKYLIHNLLHKQQELFMILCTAQMRKVRVMPTLLTSCLAKKEPQHRAPILIAQESRKWKGTFPAPGLSRFLAGGYISQEGNQGEPEGFTVFLFHPRLSIL